MPAPSGLLHREPARCRFAVRCLDPSPRGAGRRSPLETTMQRYLPSIALTASFILAILCSEAIPLNANAREPRTDENAARDIPSDGLLLAQRPGPRRTQQGFQPQF